MGTLLAMFIITCLILGGIYILLARKFFNVGRFTERVIKPFKDNL